MASLLGNGTEYVVKIMRGDYSGGLNGLTRIGIYGSVAGAADAVIGTTKATSWSTPTSSGLVSSTDYYFDVDENTVVKGFLLWSSDIGTTYTFSTALVYENTPDQTFTIGQTGNVKISNLEFDFLTGGDLVPNGKLELYKCLSGNYSSGYAGFNYMAITGTIAGGSEAIIGVAQAITWDAAGQDFISLNGDEEFAIASEDTVVMRVYLFNSTLGYASISDAVAAYTYETQYSYPTTGTHTVSTDSKYTIS